MTITFHERIQPLSRTGGSQKISFVIEAMKDGRPIRGRDGACLIAHRALREDIGDHCAFDKAREEMISDLNHLLEQRGVI